MISQKLNKFLIYIPAILIGLIVGTITYIFGTGLTFFEKTRATNPFFFIPFLCVSGLAIIFLYKKFGKNTDKGMSLVFDVGHGNEDNIPLILIPLATLSTWLTNLFGGSAGREGVAVQIGATVGNKFNKFCKSDKEKHILLLCGMAAGFSGLFQTPIAATFFALEVFTCGALEISALLPAMLASYSAYATSTLLGLEKFEMVLSPISFNWLILGQCAIIGIVFGLVGALFAVSIKFFKTKTAKITDNQYLRIFVGGIIISITSLLLFSGRYSGLGTNLIEGALAGEKIYCFDWIIKLILTAFTLAIGFQGGELTPSSAIGSSLGIILGPLLGLDPIFSAALGFCAVFAGATNTLLAPIMLGCEVFGFSMLPYFFIVCSFAYVFNLGQSIYSKQREFSIVKYNYTLK